MVAQVVSLVDKPLVLLLMEVEHMGLAPLPLTLLDATRCDSLNLLGRVGAGLQILELINRRVNRPLQLLQRRLAIVWSAC